MDHYLLSNTEALNAVMDSLLCYKTLILKLLGSSSPTRDSAGHPTTLAWVIHSVSSTFQKSAIQVTLPPNT